MSNKLVKSISSCALAAMLLSTGAAAQTATQDNAAISVENISFSGCVEKIKSVYTERYPEQVDIVNGVIDDVTSDKTFLEYYEYEGKTAFRILEDTLMDALTPAIEPYNYDGQVAWTNYTVPAIAQINNNYCGVAATQMALIGSGLIPNNATNRSEDMQKAIADTMKLNGSSANISLNITPYINSKYFSNAAVKYNTKCFTINSYSKLPYYLSDSLKSSRVPVIMIPDTSYLGYYEGYSYSHYMVVKRVDTVNKTLTVVDPFHLSYTDNLNQWKNETFFGEHTISFDELFGSPKNRKDIWASVYTYDTLGYYDYVY